MFINVRQSVCHDYCGRRVWKHLQNLELPNNNEDMNLSFIPIALGDLFSYLLLVVINNFPADNIRNRSLRSLVTLATSAERWGQPLSV